MMYLVMRNNGCEYEDAYEWAVCVCSTKEKADQVAKELEEQIANNENDNQNSVVWVSEIEVR